MKHIAILVPDGANLSSIEMPRQAFEQANAYRQSRGMDPLFRVQLVGASETITLGRGLYVIYPDTDISRLRHTDLVLIPALEGDLEAALVKNQAFIPWILSRHREGAELASLCVGAFMLAATGLLDGHSCSTHWRAMEAFRHMYPEVDLVADRIITDEAGLYSSGGSLSSANLILYIIEKYGGREVAIHCAKVFQVDMDRDSQSPFIIFQGQRNHEDEPVRKAQDFIEQNFQEKITVDQLASELALGRRSLERRFKKATSNTVVEYIQRVKIEAAKKWFENTPKNINEVMYEVGYSDTKAFRNVFKKITGLSPIDYRHKYNKMQLAG
jgi:transcriptional regulator GlxA family with amidase domain